MHLMQRILLLVVVAVVAVPAAQAQTTLRYKFKEGEKIPYVIEQKMKMSMKIMDKDVDMKMDMTMEMVFNVEKVDKDGNAKIQIKVTHAKVSMDGIMGKVEADSKDKNEPDDPVGKIFSQMAKAMASFEINGTMLTTGDLKDAVVSEASLKALKEIPGADKMGDILNPDSIKNMSNSVVFPADAVSKGKTWTNKSDTKTPLGKMGTENTFTYEGTTEKDGKTLEKISVKPVIKLEPDPKSPIKIEVKNAKGNGTILFDNKTGRMIENVTNQTMVMQIGTMGLTIEQTVDQTVTVRLKKK